MSSPEPAGGDRLSLAEVDAQLRALSGADWKRALSLARLCAAGLTGWAPESLLAETLAKLQSGERVWRPGVHPLVTLKTAMHSIASNERKKAANAPIDQHATVDMGAGYDDDGDARAAVQAEDVRTPEDAADVRSQLKYVEALVAGDEDVELVVMAWAEGLRGKEAAQELGFDMHRYEAARKRLINRLEPLAALRKTT